MRMKKEETREVEFKSIWRDDHLKIVSAFANSSGGKLYIGVDDNGKIVGVKNSKKAPPRYFKIASYKNHQIS
mgnify:CR=1 FL=1